MLEAAASRPLAHLDGASRFHFPIARRLLAMLMLLWAQTALGFDYADVIARAEQLAAAPYKKPAENLPKELEGLDYDRYRDIRFKPDKFHWRSANLPFEVAFFHQGFFYRHPVKIHEITGQGVQEIRFDPEAFDYGANKLDPKVLRGLGFAGFRIHFPINKESYKDEVITFLGASYFRALGKHQLYGMSARGLAIDTALPSGEEFPHFSEFWIQRPAINAKELLIYALLDSPRVAGAYRFVLKPDVSTTMEVSARLYLREPVGKLGIAPLTSMYYFGENQSAPREDFRPEVHDSDGLSLHASNGEWLWRPLLNPKRLLVTSFAAANPRGFGLMQRDRDFDHYEDLEARYDVRPSVWIEPKGPWGPGKVELVQIPAQDETNDNIVAFWTPDVLPKPREPYALEYRMSWQKDADARPPLAWVTQTRRGSGFARHNDGSISLIIDFDGPALRKVTTAEKLEGVVSHDANGQLLENTLYRNTVTGNWRQAVRVKRLDNDKPLELRSFLRNGTTAVSETWSYILPPE
jgi:periplasmic glucans biosynthesis protein